MAVPVRARDIRSNIKEYGFEGGVVKSLEQMAEELSAVRLTQRELANMLAQCIDQVEKMVNVGDALGKRIDEMNRVEEQGDAEG